MVGSGKKAVLRPEGLRVGMYTWRGGGGQLVPTQPVGSGVQPQPNLNVWSWRGGNQSPPNQLEGSPSGVWGAVPAEIEWAEIEFGVF